MMDLSSTAPDEAASPKPRRIVVLSRSFSSHPVLRSELLAHYPDVTFNETGRTLAGNELLEFVAGHDGVIVALEKLDAQALAAMKDVQVIGKYGVGLDNIDLRAAAQLGIRIGWTGGVNRRSVAELAIGQMIVLVHRAHEAACEVRSGVWRQLKGRELRCRTVGILGCGHVGKEVGRLLRVFGCHILAHDILDFPEFYSAEKIAPVGLAELLGRSEVLTIHLPFTAATRNMLDTEALSRLPAGAVVVNTARGGILDEDALLASLKSGHISAAALDVFANEPPLNKELLRHPNVFVTPHIGGSAEEAVLAMGRAAIAGLAEASDPLSHIPQWATPLS
jgi:phosphoglycerate dehydrogenase-like enzyme